MIMIAIIIQPIQINVILRIVILLRFDEITNMVHCFREASKISDCINYSSLPSTCGSHRVIRR
jgi:hypothetical protein